MKPKKPANKNRQRELFRVELVQIIDTGHSLVKLANVVDWDQMEKVFGATYCPNAILSAAGMNFAKLLNWAATLLRLFFHWLFGCQRALLLNP